MRIWYRVKTKKSIRMAIICIKLDLWIWINRSNVLHAPYIRCATHLANFYIEKHNVMYAISR